MADPQPLISVIIPVYNGERYLAEAVASVRAQNYTPLEIIIVDDGSTDGTAEVVRRLGDDIRYVYQPNAGPAAARNRGLRLAQSEIIAFQDADDLWAEDKLAVQMAMLKQSPNASIVLGYTRTMQTRSDGSLAPLSGDESMPRLMPHLQAALFWQRVFDQVGMLDEHLRCGEDLDWYLRALERDVQIIVHQEVVLFYRRHNTNLTLGWNITAQVLLAIRRSLMRRRQNDSQSKLLASFIAAKRS